VRKKLIAKLIFLAAVCSSLFCDDAGTINPFIPKSCYVIQRQGYIVAYDGRTRNAFWVYERLTSESFEMKNADRKKIRFRSDKTIPEGIRASLEDYRGSGFDLGHLCPFADCRSNKKAADETFILSNICPQVHQLNQGLWMKLEVLLRELALQKKVLHIITIPLYVPLEGVIHYQTLGNNHVAVPTHLSKVVFIENEKGIDAMAYILPNADIPYDASLDSFKTTLEKVERLSGIVFYRPQK
jgi:endonuclease G